MKTVYTIKDFGNDGALFLKFFAKCFKNIPDAIMEAHYENYAHLGCDEEHGRIELTYEPLGASGEKLNQIVMEVLK